MSKGSKALAISDFFNVPTRFMRSVQLERDFFDPSALDHYIVTPDMAQAFRRVAEGLQMGSGRRAWRITGDYGVGKSSFALVLAHLLASPQSSKAVKIAEAMDWPARDQTPLLWPILITGAREGVVTAVARGVGEFLRQRKPAKGKGGYHASLIELASTVQASDDSVELEALIGQVRDYAHSQCAGLLLVVDEMGKLLEHAANAAGRLDVFALQRLAEFASRSGDRPFVFVGLLHQGFQAYAERLPSLVRNEWEKVASRLEEIPFNHPLAHTAALVAGALGVHPTNLPKPVTAAAEMTAKATAGMGWLSGATSGALTLQTAALYPIHPTLLPLLVRFFARYGQHERSLFGFLLSSEPFGLQSFAERAAAADVWYGLAEFYDYVRSVFGHRLSGASHHSHWLRITATVETAQDLSALEARTLKTIAILNLLDADDLMATDRALQACLSPERTRDVDAALATLVDRGLLFRRGANGGYRLWPNSSLNLRDALETAHRAVGQLETVAVHLEPFLEHAPLLARRHYVERGTMRFFEVRYTAYDQLKTVAAESTDSDGIVLIALADTPEERAAALKSASESTCANREDLVVGVVDPLLGLTGELHDLRCWRWVADNTPELAHDRYARAEVDRQLAIAHRALVRGLGVTAALRERGRTSVTWLHRGHPLDTSKGLSTAISNLCRDLYELAPHVANELLNRNVLSSPAAAARMRLIEGLFNSPEEEFFGIDPVRAPPEKSMYLSVVQKGDLHQLGEDGHWFLNLPIEGRDALLLKPVVDKIVSMIEVGRGSRIPVTTIFEEIARRPYGVRSGLAPFLLALVVKVRAHELAIYEDGTFRAVFTGQDFMRLIKAPASFELQFCRLQGIRADVFVRLAASFRDTKKAREPQILDVVQHLVRFAVQLPEYTRKAGKLDAVAIRVRDVLLSATDPTKMLFQDLPVACGLEPFLDDAAEPERITRFVATLEQAIADLRADYQLLLKRLIDTVAATISPDKAQFDRAALAARASRVALAAKLPRLRTFANRLRDPGNSDESWVEALGSFLIERPPTKWGRADEARCLEELTTLSELFHRVEVTAFDAAVGADRVDEAIRINLTRGDGIDRVQVIADTPLTEFQVGVLGEIRNHLPQGKNERLQFLMKLLWEELGVGSTDADLTATTRLNKGVKGA